uniref:Glutaredoxin family protein n=1 Tax=candidate division WOR-3 bacterium TaxID=2052148 RepID=A0A7C4GHA0_UNCW3
MKTTHVPGKNNRHRVTFYGLSTCGWCRKAKEFLDANGIEYDYIFVDLCEGEEKTAVAARVRELNPRGSFPTIQIDDSVVVGFDEDRLQELLEN